MACQENMTSTTDASQAVRILVVDDNVDSAETMQMLLAMSGYDNTRTAYDGRAALAVAREFSPQVVFCDIGLPGKDGYAVARELRALPETSTALLVALTGYGDEEHRRRATDAGFDRFQVKPVEPGALEALLAEHFAGRSS